MKASTLLGVAVILAAVGSAQATIVEDQTFNNSGNGWTIPDGDPAGVADSETVSGTSPSSPIDYVTVGLNISGGFNGDLYGYLVYQSGGTTITTILLNRPGLGTTGGGPVLQYFGYSNPGMNVTLDDRTPGVSIQNYGGMVVNSGVPSGTLNSASGTLNSAYNGQSANGTWTLALFDMSSGGASPELVSWTLAIDVVPEPVTWAVIIFGIIAAPVLILKRKRQVAVN